MTKSDRRRLAAQATIPVNPAYVRYLKSATQAMMLEACLFLSRTTTYDGGWFQKTLDGWEYYLGVSQKAARYAKDALVERGLLEQERRGFNQTLFYRVNAEAFSLFHSKVEDAEYEHITAMQVLDEDGLPSAQKGNAQCPKGHPSSAQKGNAILLVNDEVNDPSEKASGKPSASPARPRTWDVVCEELCASMPHHSETLKLWCEYKRQRRHSPYAEVTVTKWRNWYSDFTPQRLSEEVDRAIAAGWDGIHPKTPTPQFRTPPSQPQRMSKQEQDERLKYLEGSGAL